MVGTTLGHYRILSLLGKGGMGAVYVAEDTELRRQVALKVLPPALARDAERLGRFKQEARAVAALNHPNIVTVHSVERDGDVHFITMELVRGRPLSELIPGEGLPPSPLLDLAVPLAEAVAAAHGRGVVHRDLKPDNVVVDEEGRLKVLDFGLAKLDPDAAGEADATVTTEGRLLGTVTYMSPEQAQGKPVGPPSDVFSLGILLYELATGGRPFGGDNQIAILSSIIRDAPRPVSDSVPGAGLLDPVIERCLHKDPAKRYPGASELAADLKQLQTALQTGDRSISTIGAAPRARDERTRRRVLVGGVTLLAVAAVVAVTAWLIRRDTRVRWARTEAIPRIEALAEQSTWLEWGTHAWEASALAAEAARWLGDDPALVAARDRVTSVIDLTSDPPGAEVYGKPYTDPEGPWRHVGRTPLERFRFPAGTSRLRLEAPGYGTAHDVILNISFLADKRHVTLKPEGEVPEGMVFVPGGEQDLMLPGIDHLKGLRTGDFLMDRHEVTNREYRAFVAAGGYENPEYWEHPFVDGGRTLSFAEAMGRFRDATGRPGPAGWEVGDYREGRDDLPVSGVSWYEAAAYARWAGKELPTVYHWNHAALTWASGSIVPLSNFGGEGPWPATTDRSMNRFGVADMAGNVREWCRNESSREGHRFILGGGWNDAGWAFNDAFAQSPWDRQPANGFRCIRPLDPGGDDPLLAQVIELPFRDFYRETPVSDETFRIFLRQFEYDATPLRAEVLAEDDQGDWTRQRIVFDAAYGGERVLAWLYLPKTSPPHPAVVYFPGSNAIHASSSQGETGQRFSFLLKSGRAVMFPIYKGTFERGDELDSDYPEETNFYKDHVIMWGKDLARSIDYLETRDDLDTGSLAFYGASWGGVMGTILPAVEPRIKVNLLYVAGLLFQRALPEADQINYVGRVRQPTLMINGEFDFFFPVETSQKPLYDLLGTPEPDKKYVVYPGSHAVPRNELVRELLEWLDRYQGAGEGA